MVTAGIKDLSTERFLQWNEKKTPTIIIPGFSELKPHFFFCTTYRWKQQIAEHKLDTIQEENSILNEGKSVEEKWNP